jgi:DNA/RNA-binding domain of Phe-tRNA-synthetase-like protein
MRIELTSELKARYPKAVFGSLTALGVQNMEKHEALEDRKSSLENEIRNSKESDDRGIESYVEYFRRNGKSYPIQFQLKTIREGGMFPRVSVLVDCMFLAELKNRYLISGHDLDAIQGDLRFDVSKGGERYRHLSGKEVTLMKGDVTLKDPDGILASVLFGPARRTSINLGTRNVLYLTWYPFGMREDHVTSHLNDILSNLNLALGSITHKISVHK